MKTLRLRHYLFFIIAVGILSASFHGLGLLPGVPWQIVYSDVLGFFEKASAPLSYLDKQIEYPVLTGLLIHFTGLLGQDRLVYYWLTAFFLVLFAVIATYFLYKLVPEESRARLLINWVFAPSMLVFLVYNWDLLTLLFVILAFYSMSKDMDYQAAAFLALGVSSKLYPVLYLIPLLLKKNNFKYWMSIIGVFLATALLLNGAFMILDFEGWSYFLELNKLRNSNPDSIWTIARFFFQGLDVPTINLLSFWMFAISYFIFIWKFRNSATITLCFGVTLLFLLFNKVFTPQYLLWLLPFFVLLSVQKKWFYALEFSNLGALFSILPWFFIEQNIFYFYLSTPFVITRHLMLAFLFLQILKRKIA